MQPCSREMQAMNSLLNQTQMSLQELQNHHQHIDPSQIHHQFDPQTPPSSHDDFLDHMLSSLPSSSWPDLAAGGIPKSPWDLSSNPMLAAAMGLNKSRSGASASAEEQDSVSQHQTHFDHDQSALLAAKLRHHQIGGGGASSAVKNLLMQQQMMLQSRGFGGGGGLPSPNGGSGDSGLIPMPLSLSGGGDDVDVSSFKSPSPGDGSVQALFNGFSGSLHQTPNPHFQHPQGQNYGGAATNQAPAASGSTGGAASAQPRQRVRARRGQATDPHSIAERLRRERIAERMKALQELVPNANKTDKASMLDEIIDYVKFLQLQVKVLSMSRLGGASAVAPLVADMSSERRGNGAQTASTSNAANDTMTVTEHQVAKLMEEDMGTAMQYLQGKGLCLMPISLATAISTTCRNPMASATANNPLLPGENGGGPTSPSLSALTVQSATMGNGGAENSGKDADP